MASLITQLILGLSTGGRSMTKSYGSLLRGSFLIRRCPSPVSPITLRTTFRRVVKAASDTAVPNGVDKVVFTDDALPVADQAIERVEYLWRDGDDVRPAMQLAPVSVECVLLERVAAS
jgi:hypothetical protein